VSKFKIPRVKIFQVFQSCKTLSVLSVKTISHLSIICQRYNHVTECRIVHREKRGKFSRAPRRLWAPPSLKNTEKGVPDGFILTWSMHRDHFRLGLLPGSHWGSLRHSPLPETPGQMVRGHVCSRFLPLDAFGVSGRSISGHTE